VFWYLIPITKWFAPGTALSNVMHDNTANELLWVIILLTFALICGNLRNSLFSALWYIGIEQNIDAVRAYINRIAHDGIYVFNYWQFNVEYLLILGWAVFYYRNRRKFIGTPPLLFQILTTVTPLGAAILLTYFSNVAVMLPLEDSLRIDIYKAGILIGVFIFAINLIMFHQYIRLLTAYEARSFAMEVAETPPVWTKEAGLSEAFIARYKISPREQDIIEAIIEGKTYQQIADSLFISTKTVETHLRNIYKKTNVSNRFALYTLIKG
jgi:DNA-binding CsgD family transcriptional regulator